MNPFLIKGYKSPDYFCDRKNETAKMLDAIENSRSLVLLSERRLGKTSLLNHIGYNLPGQIVFIYVDLYPTQNLQNFIQVFSGKILEKLEPFSEKVVRKLSGFFAALKPKFSFDPETGIPNLELSVTNTSEAEMSVSLLFKYIRQFNKKVVVAFDEFQQILKYPEKNIEALLRSEIQQDSETTFIFSGSQTHMLLAIFNDYSRPFYNSTQTLHLTRIKKDAYSGFILFQFKKFETQIEKEVAEHIYDLGNGITYNVQYLCNKLFSSREKVITKALANNTLEEILTENEITYYNYRELLTDLQFQLLKAIAKENVVEKPFSTSFINNYKLGSASSVRTVIKTLTKKGIIIDFKGLRVTDWFFSLWLKKQL